MFLQHGSPCHGGTGRPNRSITDRHEGAQVRTGSEISFLIRAPTGDQVQIFGRQRANCGRQKFPLPFFKIEV